MPDPWSWDSDGSGMGDDVGASDRSRPERSAIESADRPASGEDPGRAEAEATAARELLQGDRAARKALDVIPRDQRSGAWDNAHRIASEELLGQGKVEDALEQSQLIIDPSSENESRT
jgi:hypothetical protein